MLTLAQLEARLHAEQLLDPQQGLLEQEATSPWFIRTLLGFCGWLGALFFLGFLGTLLSNWIFSKALPCLLIGILACTAAVGMDYVGRQVVLRQFALAVSLAGQALVYFAIFKWLPDNLLAYLLATLFEIILLYAHGSSLPRFLSTVIAAITLALGLHEYQLDELTPVLLAATCSYLWLHEPTWRASSRQSRFTSLAYGLIVALLATELLFGIHLWHGHHSWLDPHVMRWLRHAAQWTLAAIWLWQARTLLRPHGRGKVPGYLGAVALAVAGFWIQGLIAGTIVLILGVARGNRILMGLAAAFLVFAVGRYYYDLQTTLLVKSIALISSGLFMLGVRSIWNRLSPQGERHAL